MNRLPSIRRWGVAALTGVTLFGGLSIIGAGAASAATAPTVTAALTSGATVPTIDGTGTGAGASLTLTVAGTPVVGDKIVLTLACPSSGTASFTGATDTSVDFGLVGVATAQSGTTCSTLTFTATGTTPNPTLTIVPSYATSQVSSQALSISGTYGTFGLNTTAFTVPTDVAVSWYAVSANTPAVTLTTTGTTAISPVQITEPANLPTGQLVVGSSLTLTLPATDTWSAGTTVTSAGSTDTVTGTGTDALTITIATLTSPTGSVLWTVGNSSVTTTAAAIGAQSLTVTAGLTAVATSSVGTILGTVTTIYGADGTADGTVAAEFESAYPANASTQTGGNINVVLATDAPYTNGSDALAASYLEGTLGTGLLITSPSTLGADAKSALQLEGVTTVYIVGGSLAISPAVIAQIQALPAYFPGGLALTGSNVKVVASISGADGTAAGTAAAIATHYGTAYSSYSFPLAYNTSGGAYNDTTGNASSAAPAGAVPTAILVASTDWQDAMSVAPEAYKMRFPVILNGPSSSTTLGADAQSAITALGVKQLIVIGGQLALANSIVTQVQAMGISVLRIAGTDATDTAAKIANFALSSGGIGSGLGWTPVNNAVMASYASGWTDALGSAALGAKNSQPIILVESPLVVGQYTTAELSTLSGLTPAITNLTVLGGPLAMPSTTVQALLAGL